MHVENVHVPYCYLFSWDLILAIFKNREIKDPRKRIIFNVFNVFLTFLTYFLTKSRKLRPTKYACSIFVKLSICNNKVIQSKFINNDIIMY